MLIEFHKPIQIVEIVNQLLNLNFNRLLLRRIKISLIHNCCMNILVFNFKTMNFFCKTPLEKVEKSDKAVRCEADHRSLARLRRIRNPAQRKKLRSLMKRFAV